MQWYLAALKKYAVFSGRAQRKEFWVFTLFNVLISGVLGIVDGLLFGTEETDPLVLALLYNVAVFLPALAVSVRRLHDTGRRGLWMVLVLIPLLPPNRGLQVLSGAEPDVLTLGNLLLWNLLLLLFLVQNSQPGDNNYGPNPKEVAGTVSPAP